MSPEKTQRKQSKENRLYIFITVWHQRASVRAWTWQPPTAA